MKKNVRYLLGAALLLGPSLPGRAQQHYEPTWESLQQYQAPEWFRDAKFGIFIHWGVFSVPSFYSEWYPREMYHAGSAANKHQVATYGPLNKFGYKDFIPLFKAEKFDADQWLTVFKQAGARYIVPVAEHHDGFAMYRTKLNKWNAVDMGPRRDVIGELAAATRKQGLVFGLSSHRIEHWWFFGFGQAGDTDVQDPQYASLYGPATNIDPFKRQPTDPPIAPAFMADWQARTRELVDSYHPQLLYFDWWIEQPEMTANRQQLAAYYYNQALSWHKGVVLNYKDDAFPEGTAVYDIERGSAKATKKYPWQTDTSIGKKSWGYIAGEENKDANELIDELIDVVSKNGNLLLNVGPRPDGSLAPEQQAVLLGMGQWLQVNGEGIYGTRPWAVQGEGPTPPPDDKVLFNENAAKGFVAQDIRFTQKGKTVYAYSLDVPTAATTIGALATGAHGQVASVAVLGSPEKVRWTQGAGGLVVQPLKSYPTKLAVGYKIAFR